ncbi:MAG: glycosyltransferase family 2 protein [Deltaproteobacteria bacterium]|nr:glycosyltransferase family 2 protein [Deltaproteobacteria bacterium]
MSPTESKPAQGSAPTPPSGGESPPRAQPARPRVHVTVLTWQGAHLLPDCLRAVFAEQARARAEVEVVVVDNGSTDGTADLLAREFPRATHLKLPENLGYGRANNEALRRALRSNADFCALLNNDVTLRPGWLDALLNAAAAHPRAGLLCGTLLFQDGERVNSTGLVMDAVGRASDRDFDLPLSQLTRTDDVTLGATGGAVLLRASMLREVGLFDPAYFAYYEDVDLSLRASQAGWESRFVRAAEALHKFSATFGSGTPLQRRLLGTNHLRTLALHQPVAKALALVPLVAAFRLGVKAPLELVRLQPKLAVAEVRAGVDGFVSALRASGRRVRGGIPRGAEP